MQDPIVMKQDDDKVERFHRCHTKFRFAEREAQCILGERGFSLFTVRSPLRAEHVHST